MGYELRRQLREALGPDIAGLQRAVALEIADDANETTRKSWVGLDDLARWTGAKDAIVVRNALKRLAAAGWEFRVPIGKGKDGRVLYAVPGTRMTFVVPPFEEVATATPSEDKGEQGLPQGVATATPQTAQGVATAHSEGATAHSEGATATPFSSDPSAPQEEEDSSSAVGREITPEDKVEFGNFWLLYPKSRDKPATYAAWEAAVASGVSPQKITAAAMAYAQERRGEDPKYTKYSANWLRDRRYDDVIDPDQPPPPSNSSGGWHPWRNPENQDVYDEELI